MSRCRVAIVAVAAILLNLAACPKLALAAPIGCLTDIGKRTPVLLVHGLLGREETWGRFDDPASMRGVLNPLENIQTIVFDYKNQNTRWVKDKNISNRLAEQISCTAASSRAAGGLGKVIVVAHSMGGLAIRMAAAQTVDGRKVSDDLGLVITLGTPHKGSAIANFFGPLLWSLCNAPASMLPMPGVGQNLFLKPADCFSAINGLEVGSQELLGLPPLPANVRILAIASDVHARFGFFHIWLKSTQSDLVVNLDSALAESTSYGVGDGKATVTCNGTLALPLFSDAPCEHSKMPGNPEVQQRVVAAIKQYIASEPCLTRQEFQKTVNERFFETYRGSDFAGFEVTGKIVCQDGWAATTVVVHFRTPGATRPDVISLRYQKGLWDFPEGTRENICHEAPPSIRTNLKC